MREEKLLRREVVRICEKLERKGLIAATDGNVSCRLGRDRILITPSGSAKGEVGLADLLVVDASGRVISGVGKPSSEMRMHLLVYEKRPDVQAVVHAHPPMLTAMSVAGVSFEARALPEVWLTIGPVPTAPYATPTTDEVPEAVRPHVEGCNAVVLERHGSLTMGATLEEAYFRLEKLEHAAHALFYAHMLGGRTVSPLDHEALKKLEGLGYR